MKARPAISLFLLAVLYGFFSRILGDTLQTGLFQAPPVIIPLAIIACIAFNLFYSLRPVESGFRGAAWLVTLWLGYMLAGLVHNLFLPDLSYDLSGTFLLTGAVVSLTGFVIGLVVPVLVTRKRQSRLTNHF